MNQFELSFSLIKICVLIDLNMDERLLNSNLSYDF
jgi:hypothetical protein